MDISSLFSCFYIWKNASIPINLFNKKGKVRYCYLIHWARYDEHISLCNRFYFICSSFWYYLMLSSISMYLIFIILSHSIARYNQQMSRYKKYSYQYLLLLDITFSPLIIHFHHYFLEISYKRWQVLISKYPTSVCICSKQVSHDVSEVVNHKKEESRVMVHEHKIMLIISSAPVYIGMSYSSH